MIQRVAATIAATLILWFVWWFFGGMMLLALVYGAANGSELVGILAGAIFWLVVVAIPPLLWFRFRHVQ